MFSFVLFLLLLSALLVVTVAEKRQYLRTGEEGSSSKENRELQFHGDLLDPKFPLPGRSNSNFLTSFSLSTKPGSETCIADNENKIRSLIQQGFDEVIGRTSFAGIMTLSTGVCGSRRLNELEILDESLLDEQKDKHVVNLLLDDEEAEGEEEERELTTLVVNIYRGGAQCILCLPDDGDTAPDVTSIFSGLEKDMGAHLTTLMQTSVDCLRHKDPRFTVTIAPQPYKMITHLCG
mmetsp:Transcript_22434/g.38155  ORF Transcript_22434/g.38155 Transcript_22434/m.38155 type:complete len:235 (-) Transcript_22434:53-757(-)